MVRSITLVTGMGVKTGARYGLFEFSRYIFLSSADCLPYGEVYFEGWGRILQAISGVER